MKDREVKIIELNLLLLILIISSLTNALILNVVRIDFLYQIIFILMPFVLGGMIAGITMKKNTGIIGGIVVCALAAPISLSIYMVLRTIITGPESEWDTIILLILVIPVFIVIGGVMGFIGGLIGVAVKGFNKDG